MLPPPQLNRTYIAHSVRGYRECARQALSRRHAAGLALLMSSMQLPLLTASYVSFTDGVIPPACGMAQRRQSMQHAAFSPPLCAGVVHSKSLRQHRAGANSSLRVRARTCVCCPTAPSPQEGLQMREMALEVQINQPRAGFTKHTPSPATGSGHVLVAITREIAPASSGTPRERKAKHRRARARPREGECSARATRGSSRPGRRALGAMGTS